ncbi:hypothetical protein, partial [Actinocorallia lasiicapitis]
RGAPPTGAPQSPATPAADATPSAKVTPSADATPQPGAIRFDTPQAALDHLLAAWKEGDRTAALQAAGPRTVEKVFTGLPKAAEKQIESCDKTNDGGYAYNCYWRYEGGSTHFYVNPYAATGFRVENFEQIAD